MDDAADFFRLLLCKVIPNGIRVWHHSDICHCRCYLREFQHGCHAWNCSGSFGDAQHYRHRACHRCVRPHKWQCGCLTTGHSAAYYSSGIHWTARWWCPTTNHGSGCWPATIHKSSYCPTHLIWLKFKTMPRSLLICSGIRHWLKKHE